MNKSKNKFEPQKQINIENNNERQNQISCFYSNARSVINKTDELELYVVEETPDLICITESWANANNWRWGNKHEWVYSVQKRQKKSNRRWGTFVC